MTTKEFDDLNKAVLNSEINKEIDDVKESGLVKCAVCISYTPIGLTFCDDPYHSLCFSCFLQHVRRHIAVYEGGNEKIRAAK